MFAITTYKYSKDFIFFVAEKHLFNSSTHTTDSSNMRFLSQMKEICLVKVYFSFLAKPESKPLLPYILTLMWLVRWFLSRQIWSLVSHHVHFLKCQQSCGVSSFAFAHPSPVSTLSPPQAPWHEENLSVDYTSGSHQSLTARLLTVRHL